MGQAAAEAEEVLIMHAAGTVITAEHSGTELMPT